MPGTNKSSAQPAGVPIYYEARMGERHFAAREAGCTACKLFVGIPQGCRLCTDVLTQVTTLLDSRNTQALISNNANLIRLAEASQKDGQTMLDLSKSLKIDSSTMKFLAALAIIYVPGTFVAVSPTIHLKFNELPLS